MENLTNMSTSDPPPQDPLENLTQSDIDSHPNPQRLLRQLLNRLPPDNQEICRSMLQIGWNIITQEDLQSKLFPLKSSSYASTVPVLGTVNGASTFNSTTTRDLQRNWRSRPATEDASTLTNSQTPLHSSYLSNLRKVQNGNGLDSDTGNGAKNEPRLNPEWLIENSYVKPSYKSNKSPSDYFSASHSHSSPPLSSSSLTVIQQKNVSSQEIVYTRDELFKLVANQNLQLTAIKENPVSYFKDVHYYQSAPVNFTKIQSEEASVKTTSPEALSNLATVGSLTSTKNTNDRQHHFPSYSCASISFESSILNGEETLCDQKEASETILGQNVKQTAPEKALSSFKDVHFYQSNSVSFTEPDQFEEASVKVTSTEALPESVTNVQQTSTENVNDFQFPPYTSASISLQSTSLCDGGEIVFSQEAVSESVVSQNVEQTDPENAFSNSTDVIFYQSCATSFVHETSLKATSPNSAICTDEQQTSINNVETRKFEPPSPASVSFQSPTLLEDGDSICNQEVSQYESVVFEDTASPKTTSPLIDVQYYQCNATTTGADDFQSQVFSLNANVKGMSIQQIQDAVNIDQSSTEQFKNETEKEILIPKTTDSVLPSNISCNAEIVDTLPNASSTAKENCSNDSWSPLPKSNKFSPLKIATNIQDISLDCRSNVDDTEGLTLTNEKTSATSLQFNYYQSSTPKSSKDQSDKSPPRIESTTSVTDLSFSSSSVAARPTIDSLLEFPESGIIYYSSPAPSVKGSVTGTASIQNVKQKLSDQKFLSTDTCPLFQTDSYPSSRLKFASGSPCDKSTIPIEPLHTVFISPPEKETASLFNLPPKAPSPAFSSASGYFSGFPPMNQTSSVDQGDSSLVSGVEYYYQSSNKATSVAGEDTASSFTAIPGSTDALSTGRQTQTVKSAQLPPPLLTSSKSSDSSGIRPSRRDCSFVVTEGEGCEVPYEEPIMSTRNTVTVQPPENKKMNKYKPNHGWGDVPSGREGGPVDWTEKSPDYEEYHKNTFHQKLTNGELPPYRGPYDYDFERCPHELLREEDDIAHALTRREQSRSKSAKVPGMITGNNFQRESVPSFGGQEPTRAELNSALTLGAAAKLTHQKPDLSFSSSSICSLAAPVSKFISGKPILKGPANKMNVGLPVGFCVLCTTSDHSTEDCPEPPPTKIARIRQLNLCHKCLDPGHSVQSCTRSDIICKDCQQEHLDFIFHRPIGWMSTSGSQATLMNVSRPGTPIFGYYPKSHGPDLASMQLFRSSMGSDVTSAGSDGGKDGKGSSTLIRLD